MAEELLEPEADHRLYSGAPVQSLRRHRLLGIAVFLWLGSNIFVSTFSHFARWEGAEYRRESDLCRWDCGWFASVLELGYDQTPGRDERANWSFHPLFPLSAYPFYAWLKLPAGLSLVLASKAELFLAIYAFLLLVGEHAQSSTDLFRAGSLVAFSPYLIYGHAGYSEPLYFALLCGAFVLAYKRRWIASGAAGALLSATRTPGFLFAFSYALLCARETGWRKLWRWDNLDRLLGLLLCPLGAAVYMLYLHHHTGDALAQVHIQTAWMGTTPVNPLTTLWEDMSATRWWRVWGFMSLAALMAGAWLFKLRKPELGIFLALATLVSLSHGVWLMPRYVWWQPPFLYAIYCLLRRNSAGWLLYTAYASGVASFVVFFWFSGHNFVM